MPEQLFLVEARRKRRGERMAGVARFVLTAGSRYAALSKLRAYYDTDGLDSLTAVPISGVLPIAGALVHEMRRLPPEPSTPQADANDDEGWSA